MRPFEPTKGDISGLHLIEASAGTGKTYTITTLYLRLLLERDLDVSNILVVTFTEAATKELVARIRSRLKEELENILTGHTQSDIVRHCQARLNVKLSHLRKRIVRALRQFDEASIFTIHGFCRRMLDEHAFESSALFDADILTDESSLIIEIVHDFWATETYDASPLFSSYLLRTNTWPGDLMPLGRQGAKSLDMEVLPKELSAENGDSAFLDGFFRAREIWLKDRETIIDLLTNNNPLRANVYKPEKMLAWFKALDENLGDTATPPSPITGGLIGEAITKLTPAQLDASTKKGKVTPSHHFFEACQTLLETNSIFLRKLIELKVKLLRYIRKELGKRKELLSVRSFEDLLLDLNRALQTEGGPRLTESIRHRYKAALIDEFQDTDPIQYRIFHTLFSGPDHCLYLIGDPKQSIYGFRGADIYAYLQAAHSTRDTAYTLKTNWRTDPILIDGINTLFGRVQNPFYLNSIAFSAVEPRPSAVNGLSHPSGKPYAPFQIRFVERTQERLGLKGKAITKTWADMHLGSMTARDIAELLSSGIRLNGRALRPSDLAVLTRTNGEAQVMQDAIQNLGIQSVLLSAESVFRSAEAAQLITLLSAIADAGHAGKIKAALSTDLLGLQGGDILALQKNDGEWDDWTTTFRSWQSAWAEKGIMRMMRALLSFKRGQQKTVTCRILGRERGERRLTNLKHLIELCHEAESQRHLGTHSLIRWLEGERRSPATASQSSQLRLESDGDAIRIITIHRSKGLEFPVVYLPYAWRGPVHTKGAKEILFHDPQKNHKLTLDLGSDGFQKHLETAAFEETAESMRLLYVALTRAKHLLITTWGSFHSMEKSPLARLFHNKSGDGTSKEFFKHVRDLTDEQILEDLKQFIEETPPGTIHVAPLSSEEQPPTHIQDKDVVELAERQMQQLIAHPKVTTSFSSLLTARQRAKPEQSDGRKFDDKRTSIGGEGSEPPGMGVKETVPLADFDKGPVAGSCLHKIFEVLDFEIPRGKIPASLVTATLKNHGFDGDLWTLPVCESIDDVLDTPLDARRPHFKLRGIPQNKCSRELEFIFPVLSRKRDSRFTVGSADIASLFRNYGNNVPPDYVNRLANTSVPLHGGFLKGFIDLVFEKDDRYYLVDFKSNYLGCSFADYEEEKLLTPMAEHDYYLQYHLYALALHKYLAHRLPSYDYDVHFGAVYYLFTRGMSPKNSSRTGVFRDRPSKQLIEAFSDLFEGNCNLGLDS